MSDLKLFKIDGMGVEQLSGGAVALEKSLQQVFEANLVALLGVRFLASEYVIENGRMDTLGIDENNSPVIIEYKRASNENVINQGLFYLNWLMTHRADFKWLVMERIGKELADAIDWNGPRLICIAGDFTRYDEHAVREMNRNIDLIRYRKYDTGLLLLEQLTSITSTASSGSIGVAVPPPVAIGQAVKGKYKTVSDYKAKSSPELLALYEMVDAYLRALGDDVIMKITEYYIAYRRIKNFACVEFRPQLNKLLVFAQVDAATVQCDNSGFLRDMRRIGHFGTGDLEISIRNADDFEKAKPLLERAYNGV